MKKVHCSLFIPIKLQTNVSALIEGFYLLQKNISHRKRTTLKYGGVHFAE